MIDIKIVNSSAHPLPSYATALSAGLDLHANLPLPISMLPMDRKLIPTGLSVALPSGFEAQIRPRSGLALKHGITVLNAPGTIDADYRGEVMVLLINLSNSNFVIQDGDRIAQMVVCRYEQAQFSEVQQLDTTSRGSGGFGSTGKTSN